MGLEVTDLMLFYENMLAVNNVSLECEDGQIVGVFGANSAGKSSLMYAISGLILDIQKKEMMKGGERITVLGKITFNGEDITHFKPSERARRGLILCPERRRIFAESSTLENLRIGAYLADKEQAGKTLGYVFSIFPPLADRKIQKRAGGFLSGGQQQMLAVGRALMAQPKLLLLDEPLLGLSPAIQSALVDAVKQIRDETGISVIITEQYARPILPIIDYGYIIENGSLVLEGTRQELIANPDVHAAYFGV
ncbi:MAG TPA: ATP-binding cassette domain-containing protein [Anaerolineales bacterium]|nr:ATP-binding cassette domain-containing protein [Anaerolineales bacterium]